MGVTVELSDLPFLADVLKREHSRGKLEGLKDSLLATLRFRFGDDVITPEIEGILEDLNDEAIDRMHQRAREQKPLDVVLGRYAPVAGAAYR